MCKVLIADDSEVMRRAMRTTLLEEHGIDVVGEAADFNEMVQQICDLRPDVLLLDLHLPEKRGLPANLVKAQLSTVRTVAVSFATDSEAKFLAEGYGATVLLDKMQLYTEMIPAIRKYQPKIES